MTVKTRPQKTRDRIISAATRLYNEHGYANVSSGVLAAQLGIAEGNLWYHFKTRRAILTAISENFARDIELRLELAPAPESDVVADYAVLLKAVMRELRDYRFLYRDQADYGEHEAIISQNARNWHERTQAQLHRYFAAFVARGTLDWPEERLVDLAINATIMLRYGLEYYREMGEPIEQGGGAVRGTLMRHLTLFEHRLDRAAARKLRSAIDQIDTT
jgi:AcrR family transcriptional regulator